MAFLKKIKGGDVCVCVDFLYLFMVKIRVKRGKENVRSGCLFSTFLLLSNVFECIFSQIWRRKNWNQDRVCEGKFCRAASASCVRSGLIEKNNFALFFLSRRRLAGRALACSLAFLTLCFSSFFSAWKPWFEFVLLLFVYRVSFGMIFAWFVDWCLRCSREVRPRTFIQ